MRPSSVEHTSNSATTYRRPLAASHLIGDKVRSREGDLSGSLREIMVDVQRSRIAYGVLETGSFLGMGGRLLASPFEAFTVDEKDHSLVLDVLNKEGIKNAEGFDKSNWPDFASKGTRTNSYFGYEPYFGQEGERPDP